AYLPMSSLTNWVGKSTSSPTPAEVAGSPSSKRWMGPPDNEKRSDATFLLDHPCNWRTGQAIGLRSTDWPQREPDESSPVSCWSGQQTAVCSWLELRINASLWPWLHWTSATRRRSERTVSATTTRSAIST